MTKLLKIILFLTILSFEANSQENNLEHFSISDGLINTSINDITQDKTGYLWLATDKGLIKFDGTSFKIINLHTNSKAISLFAKNKTLFIGHEKGIFSLKNGKFNYLGKEKVLKIVIIRNKVLLCTTQGLYEYSEKNILPLKINSQIDFSVIQDVIQHKKSIYIASNNGLWNIEKLKNPENIQKISDERFSNFLINNNKIVASSLENELNIIDKNKIISSYKTIENISSIKKIKDEIWVSSSENGIEILDANNYTFKRKINKYNTDISNKINNVFLDNQNTIWIASKDRGLYEFSDVNTKKKPTILIENISVNYKDIPHIFNKDLQLNSTQNNISFSFKTVDLKNSKNIQYQYTLNKKTSPWSYQNQVNFANLKAGKYTFSVQSKNKETLSKKTTLSFIIDSPIYQKIWFQILCGVIVCLLLAGIVEVYIRQEKNKNKKKIDSLKLENHLLNLEQKALQLQMNPHFIFNVLNGIKALGNSGKSIELNKTISQFSILLRSVLNNSRLEKISLKDEIITLETYLQLEQQMSSKSFHFSIETSLKNIDSEEILIPPMLIQPFVENCIKHAFNQIIEKAEIKIQFEVKNKFLYFKIIDNGIGYNQEQKEKKITTHKSIAVKLTKERIQNLSKYNSFSIKEIMLNNKISGTKVSFKIPLITDY